MGGFWKPFILSSFVVKNMSSRSQDLLSSVCCDQHSLSRTCIDHWDLVCSRVLGCLFLSQETSGLNNARHIIHTYNAAPEPPCPINTKSGDQAWMPLGLTQALAEHACGRGLASGSRKTRNCKAQNQIVCASMMNGLPRSTV